MRDKNPTADFCRRVQGRLEAFAASEGPVVRHVPWTKERRRGCALLNPSLMTVSWGEIGVVECFVAVVCLCLKTSQLPWGGYVLDPGPSIPSMVDTFKVFE